MAGSTRSKRLSGVSEVFPHSARAWLRFLDNKKKGKDAKDATEEDFHDFLKALLELYVAPKHLLVSYFPWKRLAELHSLRTTASTTTTGCAQIGASFEETSVVRHDEQPGLNLESSPSSQI